MITKKCDECGKGFEVDNSKRNWQSVIVCSDECRLARAARKRREKYVPQEWPQEMVCEHCNKTFLVHNAGQKSRRKYCTRQCYLDYKKWQTDLEVQESIEKKICESCGKAYLPSKFKKDNQKYCSKTCFRHEMWRKHEGKKTNYYDFIRVRKEVLKEHNKTCILCGSKKSPHVHHFDGNRKNNIMDNLTVLCRKCHYAIHGVTVIKADGNWEVSGKIFEILKLTGTIKINPN